MFIFLIGLIGTLHSVFVVVQDMNQYPVDTMVTVTSEEYVYETKLILLIFLLSPQLHRTRLSGIVSQ